MLACRDVAGLADDFATAAVAVLTAARADTDGVAVVGGASVSPLIETMLSAESSVTASSPPRTGTPPARWARWTTVSGPTDEVRTAASSAAASSIPNRAPYSAMCARAAETGDRPRARPSGRRTG
jgi:hypothetical protein